MVQAYNPLFFLQVLNQDDCNNKKIKSISTIEVKIERSVSISIININRPPLHQYKKRRDQACIYGVRNKIIINQYQKNKDIIYDLSTDKESKKSIYKNLQPHLPLLNIVTIYHFKYSLISLQSKAVCMIEGFIASFEKNCIEHSFNLYHL